MTFEPRVAQDLGGNVGAYTFLFASAGWRVVTVEPMSHNRRAMEATLCLNPSLRERIRLVPAALAPRRGMGSCVAHSDVRNSGNGVLTCGKAAAHINCSRALDRLSCGVAPSALSHSFGTCEPVETRTLDEVLASLPTEWRSAIRAVKLCASRPTPFSSCLRLPRC